MKWIIFTLNLEVEYQIFCSCVYLKLDAWCDGEDFNLG